MIFDQIDIYNIYIYPQIYCIVQPEKINKCDQPKFRGSEISTHEHQANYQKQNVSNNGLVEAYGQSEVHCVCQNRF